MAWNVGTGNMLFLLSIRGHFSQGDGPSEVRLGVVVDLKPGVRQGSAKGSTEVR